MTFRALIFALCLSTLALAQEDEPKWTLDKLLDAMQAKTEGIQDLSFSVETATTTSMGMPGFETRVRHLRDVGVHIEAGMNNMGRGGGMGAFMMYDLEYLYTPDSLYLVQKTNNSMLQKMGGAVPSGLMSHSISRIRYADKDFQHADHMFMPSGFPVRIFFDEMTSYYSLAPKMMFRLEPGLRLEEPRKIDGKEFLVLSSHIDGTPLKGKLRISFFSVSSTKKEFLIDPDTLRIRRAEITFNMEMEAMGRSDKQGIQMMLDVKGYQKVTDQLSIPTAVEWTAFTERRGIRKKENEVLNRTIKDVRLNTGLKKEDLVVGSETDVYSDVLLRKPEYYEEKIKKSPKDPGLYMSLAAAQAMIDPLMGMMPGGGAEKPDPDKIIASLEKVLELRPECTTPYANLMELYASQNLNEKLDRVITRIEKDDKADWMLLFRAGIQLNADGKYDRAVTMLKRTAEKARSPMRKKYSAIEMMRALAGLGKAEELVKSFTSLAASFSSSKERVDLLKLVSERATNLAKDIPLKIEDVDAVLSKMDDAFTSLVRTRLWVNAGRTEKAAAILGDMTTEDREYRVAAMNLAGEILDAKADLGEAIKAAVERVGKGTANGAYLLGRIHLAADRKEEASKAFADALTKVDKDSVEIVSAITEVKDLPGGTDWIAECAMAMIQIQNKGGDIPFDLIWSEEKNPVLKLAIRHAEGKQWAKLYELYIEAGKLLQQGSSWNIQNKIQDRKACVDAVRPIILKLKKVEGIITGSEFFRNVVGDSDAANGLLEEARKLDPKSERVLRELYNNYEHNDPEKAAAVARDLLKIKEAEGHDARDLNEIRVQLANSEIKAGQKEGGKNTLDGIHAKDTDGRLAQRIGGLYKDLEEIDKAIEWYRKSIEMKARPYLELGLLLESKKDHYEALRLYNKDIAEGSTSSNGMSYVTEAKPIDPDDPNPAPKEQLPKNGKEARERLMKKLGDDWLIQRLLKEKFEALSEPDAAKAEELLEALSDGSIVQRDEAAEALEKMGRNVAPLLGKALDDGDEEVRGRVKAILSKWAEPR